MANLEFDPSEMRKRIRYELDRQQRSQAEVTKAAELGHGYLTNILNREQMPSVDKLHAISQTLGVSVSWLMYGEDCTSQYSKILHLVEGNPVQMDALLTLLRSAETGKE